MEGPSKLAPEIDAPQILDVIQKDVYAQLKPLGFRKHGRTLHRFVEGDISQVVTFQLGQAYLGVTHLLTVNTGIRVPESYTRSFLPEENPKKYYHDHSCNIRSRLGEVEGQEVTVYDLRTDTTAITADILRQLQDVVLPAFAVLSSRDAILAKRREYPHLDRFNDHLIALEEAMIHGRRGDLDTAWHLFRQYYRHVEVELQTDPKKRHLQGHLEVLQELARKLAIPLTRYVFTTHLGPMEIQVDGVPVAIVPEAIPLDRRCSKVMARHRITVQLPPDGRSHRIECRFCFYHPTARDGAESGEGLDGKAFYDRYYKLTLGVLDREDHETEALPDGMAYVTNPETQSRDFPFGIAWIHADSKWAGQTFFAADPCMM